ncbi:2-oxo-4-hydroxy-4-carboxy-5-ureidoimidazoline decarboxylase [Egbenema bharatensis]|uniref:2-oxo-4-hydroxy-4-carboxy-5-ureidoimidazoline decarboxylase n=1 Tax=Egbenema bharatensis TaxID=3463334 RepID=UPI003A8987E9
MSLPSLKHGTDRARSSARSCKLSDRSLPKSSSLVDPGASHRANDTPSFTPMTYYTIAELNQMSQDTFTEVLGAVYEHTPSIATQAWTQRPFQDVHHLHQSMVAIVQQMSPDETLDLIRAHPDLGSKTKMAEASVQEQSGVGLDRLTPEEFDRFQSLNQAYKNKFSFPFIVAVKNHTKASILEAFDRRLKNAVDAEKNQALDEINQIAYFRLMNLVEERLR